MFAYLIINLYLLAGFLKMSLSYNKLKKISNNYRYELFKKFVLLQQGHPGSIFSILDFLTVLFHKKYIKIKNKNLADKIIISKGHATSALYPIFKDLGIIKKSDWNNWGTSKKSCLRIFGNISIPGVHVTTGSLGHGLGVGAGFATANYKDKKKQNIYVIISEGELYEGSTWETLLYISHYKLKSVKIIIDVNNLIILGKTNDCLKLNPIEKKIKGFGFKTKSINAHNFSQINSACEKLNNGNIECLIINSVKGKGLKMMENKPVWHYWNKLTTEKAEENKIELQKKI